MNIDECTTCIKKLVRVFLITINKQEKPVVQLPIEAEDFCTEYYKEFQSFETNFKDLPYYKILCNIEHAYNCFMIKDIENKAGTIEQFDIESSKNFIALLREYCTEEGYKAIPEGFVIIVSIVSNMLFRDQNLHKYSVELSNESKKKLDEFSDIVTEKESYIYDKMSHFDAQLIDNLTIIANNDEKSIEIAKRLRKLKDDLDNSEKKVVEHNITILGIFSAIVLTFNAGVSFSAVVLQNLITASIYRSVLLTLILGLILGNVIVGLFAYLEYVRKKYDSKPNRKNIVVKPADDLSTWQKIICFLKKIFGGSKLKKILLSMNLTFLVLMCTTILLWYGGFVEDRNGRIFNDEETTSSPETTLQEETTICDETIEYVLEQS